MLVTGGLKPIVSNPISKYLTERSYMNYSCLGMNITDYSLKQRRSISIRAVWNFDYGKKFEAENHSTESMMNSAIMKSY